MKVSAAIMALHLTVGRLRRPPAGERQGVDMERPRNPYY